MFISGRPNRFLKISIGILYNYGPGVRGTTAQHPVRSTQITLVLMLGLRNENSKRSIYLISWLASILFFGFKPHHFGWPTMQETTDSVNQLAKPFGTHLFWNFKSHSISLNNLVWVQYKCIFLHFDFSIQSYKIYSSYIYLVNEIKLYFVSIHSFLSFRTHLEHY